MQYSLITSLNTLKIGKGKIFLTEVLKYLSLERIFKTNFLSNITTEVINNLVCGGRHKGNVCYIYIFRRNIKSSKLIHSMKNLVQAKQILLALQIFPLLEIYFSKAKPWNITVNYTLCDFSYKRIYLINEIFIVLDKLHALET